MLTRLMPIAVPAISRRDALALLGAMAIAEAAGCGGVEQAAPPGSTTTAAPATPPAERLPYVPLHAMARRLAARGISSLELTQRMLGRIARVDATLDSYATVMTDHALDAARRADRDTAAGRYRGPLHGMPVAVKDLCFTKGVRTMGGLAVRRTFVPDEDATVVARLQAAGAVILGKLNLAEGALAGYNPALGIPLNPWDTSRWPGLSSSGSGVATAAGLCFASIGTDTGGSIRFPAAANGVVGLKPTYGRVSRYGVMELSRTFDHVGPLARRVEDVAIMLDAIAGADANDPTTLDAPSPAAVAALKMPIAGLRIGIDRRFALEGIDPGQASSIDAALKVLTGLGATIVDVQMPNLSGMVAAWMAIVGTEALAAHHDTYPSRAGEYGPYFATVLAGALKTTRAEVQRARRLCARVARDIAAMLASVDVVALPAGGAPAFPISRDTQVGPLEAYHALWDTALPRAGEFTVPMNVAGVPAICLPSGFSPEGLPYSIQFVGPALSEALLCRVAYAYESATDWHTKHPPGFA